METQAPLFSTISQRLLKFMSIKSVMLSNHLILFCSLLLCLQSFPSSEPFAMSQLFTSGGQSLGASVSATALPMNIQDSFSLGLTGLISCNPRDSEESSPAPRFESNNSLVLSLLYDPTLTSICNDWKNHSFDFMELVSKVMSLLFNMLSRFVIALYPRSKHLFISFHFICCSGVGIVQIFSSATNCGC